MTPKEKAEEIFDKHYRLFNNFPNYQYVIENLNTIQDEKLYTAKQCALIAVDEMMEVYASACVAMGMLKEDAEKQQSKYLQEVKQEIEKL